MTNSEKKLLRLTLHQISEWSLDKLYGFVSKTIERYVPEGEEKMVRDAYRDVITEEYIAQRDAVKSNIEAILSDHDE